MSSVVIAGDTSGSVTLSAPAVAGSTVLTLPSVSGSITTDVGVQTLTNKTLGNTVVQASNASPAFSAWLSANQNITSSTFTKVQINTEEFDTASAYDNVTNYRFTPLVGGYYQVNGVLRCDASGALTRFIVTIYKNGAEFKRGTDTGNNTTEGVVSSLIYLNGSTDYIELYTYIVATSAVVGTSGQNTNYFQASMVRSA